MLWRKFKLDWPYAIGELLIVTLGVLFALGIQQWNDDRLALTEEQSIIDRLLVDLQVDLGFLNDMTSAVEEKEESLGRLKEVFESGERPADLTLFLQDLVVGANYGWNQAQPRSSTYVEVVSSGKFGLIRSADVRNALTGYHGLFNSFFARADARETRFPQISYQVMLRSRESERASVLLSPNTIISDKEVEQLVDKALASDIRHYVIAETNLARFILRASDNLRVRHEALRSQMQAYRVTLK